MGRMLSMDGSWVDYIFSSVWEQVALHPVPQMFYAVLLLYYVATDPNVSAADKAKIYGALGYFILPIDLIPDITPGVGYTDDMAALMWALHAVWSNVTPETEAKAKKKLHEWFGEVKENDLKLI